MKKDIVLSIVTILLIFLEINSQDKIKKIVVDGDSGNPIKNVVVFNSKNNSLTNDNGEFVFFSKLDSICFKHIGYSELNTTTQNLKNIDTIKLKLKIFSLNEITISSEKTLNMLLSNSFYNIVKKSPSRLTEKFFLRSTVKKNGFIILLKDIQGKVSFEKIFFKKNEIDSNVKLELLNMRSAYIIEKSKKIEGFELLSFSNLFFKFISFYANPSKHEFTDLGFIDKKIKKIEFKPKLDKISNTLIGYYLVDIDKKDLIEISYYTNPNTLKSINYIEKKGFKWKLNYNSLNIAFSYNSEKKKYFISKAKLSQKVEVINPSNKTNIYEVEYMFIPTELFLNDFVKKSINLNKSISKLKIKFNSDFWLHQNQLLLNPEQKSFLENSVKLNSKESEFKVISNF